jgi:glycosyltransferase involved in cell wall biosynthesis
VVAADVVVVIVPRSMGDDVAWPVKMFEALALGKPILAITSGGATEALLLELGQGAGCARDDDPRAVANALGRVVRAPPTPVAPARIARFDRAAVTRRYAELLDELVSR